MAKKDSKMQYIIGGVYKIRSYYVQNTMYIW